MGSCNSSTNPQINNTQIYNHTTTISTTDVHQKNTEIIHICRSCNNRMIVYKQYWKSPDQITHIKKCAFCNQIELLQFVENYY